LSLPEGVELGHVLLDGSAIPLSSAEEAMVLGAVKAEPLIVGAVLMAQAVPLAAMHRASLLAQALTALDGRVRAITLPVAVTARVDPIPVCKDNAILN
jgi:hypothetical protein